MTQRGKIEFASAGVADLALADGSNPNGAQKAVDGGLRGTNPGTPPFFGSIGLHLGNAIGDDRKTAWCDIAAQARRRDFGGRELLAQQRGQIRDRAALHPRRDFLR